MNSVERWLSRIVPATREERAAALWSFAYFFTLLAGYYVLRPLRDQMGIAGGVKNLPWLFTATFVTLLVAQPLYGALVARVSRARFIPIVYHFFVCNLILFWVLLNLDIEAAIMARIFFVWVSVFNLFAVAVFWSFMADLFNSEQGKRLFGFIGAGGTAGALLGPTITILLSVPLGPINLILVAVVFLELAVFCVYRLERAATRQAGLHSAEKNIGGGSLDAVSDLVRSPYLMGVAAWVGLLSYAATIIYFEQAHIVSEAVKTAGLQTRIFASIDLAVNLLTVTTQLLITGHVLRRVGTGIAAAALPTVYIVGFAVLAVMPTLAVVVTVQVVQRWMHFAIANPARQLFFTVVSRGEKYKTKNFIDVVVYRGSDALSGWIFDSLQGLGLKLGAIALCSLPVVVGWFVLSIGLGRVQERRFEQSRETQAKREYQHDARSGLQRVATSSTRSGDP
jgi:ATP:ADP antiporter, AAA family